jgi:predicted Zn-dependent protease
VRALFDSLADALDGVVRPGELIAATLEAEGSDFVRLNGARIRQAGRVERAVAQLRLVDGERQAFHTLTLPGLDAGADAVARAVREAVDGLRSAVADSAPDPLLDVNREPVMATDHGPDAPFDRDAFVDTVAAAAGDSDLVGFCAAGPIARGFCSSAGSRQWYQRASVVFEWSIHLPIDDAAGGARKAVKAGWSGPRLDPGALAAAIARSRADATVMARPVRRLEPGEQRVLLAPRAFADLLETLSWGGFSARAHRAGQSPLARLQRGEARLSALLSMAEDLDAGFAPGFQGDGYARPRRVPLIEQGRFEQWLASPRTAREYGLPSNAAASHESPESLRVAPGTLADADALARLGTGLSVANLWYLNFSDRPAGRITGMTRFACLWVEDGEPVAPVEAMRFDDSLYRMLGDTLEALGDTPHRMPATDTYSARATGGIEAPSALLGALRFAL